MNQLDRLPEVENTAELLRKSFLDLAAFYNFEKISTAIIEDPKVFAPLAKANMLTERPPLAVKTQSGAELMMRPAGALGVLRAYRTHKMNDMPHPIKLFFEGYAFHANSGRESGFQTKEEAGLVMIGEEGPIAEAQIMQVMIKALEGMGIDLKKTVLIVNSPGCNQCFPHFRNALSSYFRSRAASLCKDSRRDLKMNPTAILSCKEEKCMTVAAHAPQILDFLCESCKKHLRGFFEFMDEMRIQYVVDPKRFRIGSWLTTLIFEFMAVPAHHKGEPVEIVVVEGQEDLPPLPPPPRKQYTGPAITFAEGGRISRAGELLNGKRLDAATGSIFLDTVAQLLTRGFGTAPKPEQPKIFLAQLGELARRRSLAILEMLREAEIPVRESLGRDAIKSQLKVAEKVGAELALIVGQKEALDQTVIVREVDSSIQETVPQEKLIDFLRRRLKK